VGLVVLSRFQAGRTWQPRTLAAGPAVLEMMNHTVCAMSRPDEALATLRQVAKTATILKGVRGEADEVARGILDRVARRPKSWAAIFATLLTQGVGSCYRKLAATS